MKKYFRRWIYGLLGVIALVVLLAAYVVLDMRGACESGPEFERIIALAQARDCEAIPPAAYTTFLIFNPPHLQTCFYRSECYQNLAIERHDEQLCDRVVQRISLYLDGSGISRRACIAQVRRQKAGPTQ